ncbi:MAG: hypothetical protein KGJ80_03465 [Chloroflexota bacterium]|nr:hypothetical protein [Chloroflexota bacterium]
MLRWLSDRPSAHALPIFSGEASRDGVSSEFEISIPGENMSRDFILVFSGGVVSLMTTLVVLFVMDYFYRRDQRAGVIQRPQPKDADQRPQSKVAEPMPGPKVVEPKPQPVTIEQTPVLKVVEQKPQPAVVDLTPAPKVVEPKPQPAAVEPARVPKPAEQPAQKTIVDQAPHPNHLNPPESITKPGKDSDAEKLNAKEHPG